MTQTTEERFTAKYLVDAESGCWLWTASIRSNGYSQFRLSPTKNGYGHIYSYELHIGPVPKGMTLDHLCRVRHCVNPEHLEPVPIRENIMRGETIARRNAEKTHCERGHALSGANLYVYPDGRRACRKCMRRWRDDHAVELREYNRQYFHKRYADNSGFQEKHRAAARERMRAKRAEAKNPDPPDSVT